jgi:hypothetical protein
MGVTPKSKELKLRFGVNWQGALKQKSVNGRKARAKLLEAVGYRASDVAVTLHSYNKWRYGL